MTGESEAGVPGLRTPASAVLALLPLVGVPAILVTGRPWVFAAVTVVYLATAVVFWEDSRAGLWTTTAPWGSQSSALQPCRCTGGSIYAPIGRTNPRWPYAP